MSPFDYGTIVIGGGAAGLTAAIWSAKLGSKTLIVEKEKNLGGDCLHYGCVPSKSLIKSAYVYHLMRRAEHYGLPQVNLPPVDFVKVRERIQKIIGRIQEHDSPQFLKAQYNIATEFDSPSFLDNHTIALNGKKITAKNFILATGSAARIPSLDGLQDIPFLTNLNIFSLDKLPKTLLVLGAGPIGMEMAQAFRRLGSRLTVVQTGKQILPKEDRDVADYVQNLMKEEGIAFEMDATAAHIQKSEAGIHLTVKQNGLIKRLEGEQLLVATGRRPNVEGLHLEKASVECSSQGIKVNRFLQTSAKNIFACGDCHGGYLFTHVAEHEARIASINSRLPMPFLKMNYSNVPWCTFLDPEVASVGLNETRAQKAGVACRVYRYEFADIDRALAEGEPKGFVKILTNTKGKIIGAQIVGLHAGELIHEWVAVLNAKVDIGKIEKSIHVYPTLAQINKKVSGHYLASRSALVKIVTYVLK